jgi:hypothetical protein
MKTLLAVGSVLAVLAEPCLAFQYTVCYKKVMVPAYELGRDSNHVVMATICQMRIDPDGMGGNCGGYQGVTFDFESDAKKWMAGNCN